jgi:hypothetical protein
MRKGIVFLSLQQRLHFDFVKMREEEEEVKDEEDKSNARYRFCMQREASALRTGNRHAALCQNLYIISLCLPKKPQLSRF